MTDLFLVPPQIIAQIVMLVDDGTITRATGRELQNVYVLAAQLRKLGVKRIEWIGDTLYGYP